jgi:hypothetical protein
MDFLVINQFKVELTSGRGHVIPDAVLFVNGIPLVVVEFKSPSIQNPLIDYIVVHELVHLQEPHHSPEFWQAIDRALPIWRQLKDALRSDGASFLVFGMYLLRSL